MGPPIRENTKILEFRDFDYFVCLNRSRIRNRKPIFIVIAIVISKFHDVSEFLVGQGLRGEWFEPPLPVSAESATSFGSLPCTCVVRSIFVGNAFKQSKGEVDGGTHIFAGSFWSLIFMG